MGLGLFVKKDQAYSDFNDIKSLISFAAESSSSSESNHASPGLKKRLKIFEDITTEKVGSLDESESDDDVGLDGLNLFAVPF